MSKISSKGILNKPKVEKLRWFQTVFPGSFELKGGETWFNSTDKHDIDIFIVECIEKHNALSPSVLVETSNSQIDLNEQLLESIQFQNRLLSELITEVRKINSHVHKE
jgi:hypothetical protein